MTLDLDDRQRALEALARTLTSSAEQISIAAKGLHEVAELAQKNIRQAEHLPQKLHEKIAELRVAYGGRGQITDVQQPRYGAQVLDVLLPY